jgi:hypothetical protein
MDYSRATTLGPDGPVRQPSFEARIKDCYEIATQLQSIHNRVSTLADRMLGGPPRASETKGGPTPVANGMLEALGDAISQSRDYIQLTMSQLDRIEGSL